MDRDTIDFEGTTAVRCCTSIVAGSPSIGTALWLTRF